MPSINSLLSIQQIDTNPILNSSNLITSGAVFEALKNASGGNNEMIFGTYTGTGSTASSEAPNKNWTYEVVLGFQPKLLLVLSTYDPESTYGYRKVGTFFAIPGHSSVTYATKWGDNYDALQITPNGFLARYYSTSSGLQCNIGYGLHNYIAWK